MGYFPWAMNIWKIIYIWTAEKDLHRYPEVMGSNPVQALISQLLKMINLKFIFPWACYQKFSRYSIRCDDCDKLLRLHAGVGSFITSVFTHIQMKFKYPARTKMRWRTNQMIAFNKPCGPWSQAVCNFKLQIKHWWNICLVVFLSRTSFIMF